MSERQYDVVLYGASGFTGQQTVAYFARHAETGSLRWAIAGRNRQKLEAVKEQASASAKNADVLVADSRDRLAVEAIVSNTQVVLNTAGPFARYGDAIVDACVKFRTHYVDITGETVWIKQLIARHQQQAAADGTRIIPCCGFDSVPSDLGTYLIVRHLQHARGLSCASVKGYFQAFGGWNGGTLATVMNLYDSGQWVEALDPFLLDPPGPHTDAERARNRDPTGISYDADIAAWVGPFFMGPVNTRVVRRSSALYALWQQPYGPDFSYQEFLKYDPPLAPVKAIGVSAALGLIESALRYSLSRRLLNPLLPAPGSGPPKQTIENGWFSCELIALASNGDKLHGVVRDRGDPSNRVTVKCLCESALGLVLNNDALPGGRQRGGILTPATGLGEVLAERLRQAGMVIEIGV